MMPVVNGLTALREIRERFPSTYVIMFTGKGSEEIAVELMKAGAADYILKPFSNANLIERIEGVLRWFRLPNWQLQIPHRITSYNVCYTKLLRLLQCQSFLFDPVFQFAIPVRDFRKQSLALFQ